MVEAVAGVHVEQMKGLGGVHDERLAVRAPVERVRLGGADRRQRAQAERSGRSLDEALPVDGDPVEERDVGLTGRADDVRRLLRKRSGLDASALPPGGAQRAHGFYHR